VLVPALAILLATVVTDWITAASTAGLGFFGAGFTIWQFRAQGFRPKCIVKIDAAREAILVHIENRGRAEGVIARVVVVDGDRLAIEPPASIAGFADGYRPTTLPGLASMRLIVLRPDQMGSFPPNITVKVDWGHWRASRISGARRCWVHGYAQCPATRQHLDSGWRRHGAAGVSPLRSRDAGGKAVVLGALRGAGAGSRRSRPASGKYPTTIQRTSKAGGTSRPARW
jgi:hypothetical protein